MFKMGLIISSALLTAYAGYMFIDRIADKIKDYYRQKKTDEDKKEKKDIMKILYYEPSSPPARLLKFGFLIVAFALMQMAVGKFVFSGVAAIFAYNLPGMAAKRKYKRMFALFGEQLIDSFGFLRNSLQAGSSLSQALQIMVDQSSPPLSEEFEEVLKKNQFGVPLDKALNELDAKMGNKDLHLGILAMNVTREYGGNLSEILKRVVDVMRDRMRIAKKIDSITAQGKLSGWIITAIPFFLIVVLTLLQPELFGMMFTTVLGNVMLGVAVLFVTVGNIVIQKVVAINI